MTSASSSSARSLFADSKMRLADRVQVNVNNIASLTRQIQRGSKSNEQLMRATREFVQTEISMDNIENNLKKMELIAVHLQYQQQSMTNSLELVGEVSNQALNIEQKLFAGNNQTDSN